jgi:hypothetical protein
LFEGFQAFAETGGVFVGDGEDADAALGAAGFADEVMAAALVGVGYGSVYDLDQVLLVTILHCRRHEVALSNGIGGGIELVRWTAYISFTKRARGRR